MLDLAAASTFFLCLGCQVPQPFVDLIYLTRGLVCTSITLVLTAEALVEERRAPRRLSKLWQRRGKFHGTPN